MSLVICSNQDADGKSDRQLSSVYEPWSFRNTLSSTYKIPANAQVALQSCKVNVDGRVVVSESNNKFYQYFGQKLNLDGTTAPQHNETTSYPVYTDFLLNSQQGVLEVSVDDFANVIQKAIRETTFHPNVKETPTCEVLRNASSRDFLGYKITYDQTTSKAAGVPANGAFEQWYRDDGVYSDESGSGIFSFTTGVFQRETTNTDEVCAAIAPALPMHNLTGEFTVNISGTSGRANASGVEWHVGLSRYINNVDENGFHYPSYSDYFTGDSVAFDQECYVDFGIARDTSGNLTLYEHSWNTTYGATTLKEVEYWNNASSFFSTKENLSGKNYTKVKFEVEGEVVKAKIYDGGDGKGGAPVWRTITEYASGQPKDSYFKPVNQSCWCLHPVLAVGITGNASRCTLEIEEFNDVDLVDYNPKVAYKGGWFETMELIGKDSLCRNLEARSILRQDGVAYTQVGVNASDGIVYDNVLILQQSDIYKITPGANAAQILGFNGAIIDTPTTVVNLNKKSYQSNFAPSLVSSLSMFVRLNNFGQNCVNARVGNRSKILAHLTDLESKSGRNTYEPGNLIFLDLDNPAELNVNEFDISFCYSNEQYATILTGQSIVCLYFRKKPKELE
jgi:hypothetical protein